ncbi:MAG TPA: DUF2780 domain-containing protein [Vicinamibacterales bacterium]
MARQRRLGMVFVALVLIAVGSGVTGRAATQATTPKEAAAAKASPELVGILSKELGSTPDQAAGAAGSLFEVAKSRLEPGDFSKVASAVPGMTALLGAAPKASGATGASGALSQLAGSAGGLSSAVVAFEKLGLKPEMVAKAIPVLTSFVSKSGGANVGSLLAGVLK